MLKDCRIKLDVGFFNADQPNIMDENLAANHVRCIKNIALFRSQPASMASMGMTVVSGPTEFRLFICNDVCMYLHTDIFADASSAFNRINFKY